MGNSCNMIYKRNSFELINFFKANMQIRKLNMIKFQRIVYKEKRTLIPDLMIFFLFVNLMNHVKI